MNSKAFNEAAGQFSVQSEWLSKPCVIFRFPQSSQEPRSDHLEIERFYENTAKYDPLEKAIALATIIKSDETIIIIYAIKFRR